jgi:hypothetical protein
MAGICEFSLKPGKEGETGANRGAYPEDEKKKDHQKPPNPDSDLSPSIRLNSELSSSKFPY